jgi:hypothetical protein
VVRRRHRPATAHRHRAAVRARRAGASRTHARLDGDALAGKLARLGHEPCWDADLPGARRFYVDDPFGNRLELLARER